MRIWVIALALCLAGAIGCVDTYVPQPTEDAMPTEQAWAPTIIAAGKCPSSVATPTGQAQNVFGALFRHSGVGFWEIDFAGTYPTLDPLKVLLNVGLDNLAGPGVAGFQYAATWSAGPLWAISTFRSDTNAQADCDLDLMFWLLPTRR